METVAPASRTAEYMALFRALETARPRAERLFTDPLATVFLRTPLRAAVVFSRLPAVGGLLAWALDRGWPGARSSGIARTRFIDDAVEAAVRAGIAQVVLLGAGYDARPYRMPELARVRVFEVDRESILARKQRALAARGLRPGNVSFVPMDFGRGSLEEALRAAGLEGRSPACFVWEGVTNYLSPDAVDATLRSLGQTAAGGVVVFTYVHRAVLEGEAFLAAARLRGTVRKVGEPWTFGFDPAELQDYLAARGLELLEDLGAADDRARVWGSTASAQHGYEFYRIARARIVGAESMHAQG